MGKATGFLEYTRQNNIDRAPLERLQDYCEFHLPISPDKRSGTTRFTQITCITRSQGSSRQAISRNSPAAYVRLCVRRPASAG